MTVPSLSAAKRLCVKSDWTLTNLHVQKLLYIAHMFYMGKNEGEPLVMGHFEAWAFGPVHPKVYHTAKVCEDRPILSSVFKKITSLEGDSKNIVFLDDAVEQVPLAKLVAITHWKEGAWYKNYAPHIRGIIIPNSDIVEEYEKRVAAAEAKKA